MFELKKKLVLYKEHVQNQLLKTNQFQQFATEWFLNETKQNFSFSKKSSTLNLVFYENRTQFSSLNAPHYEIQRVQL